VEEITREAIKKAKQAERIKQLWLMKVKEQ
jgi:hypothetical protein